MHGELGAEIALRAFFFTNIFHHFALLIKLFEGGMKLQNG